MIMEKIRNLIRKHISKLVTENYPPGARLDPSAPYNQKDDEYTEPEGIEYPFKGLFFNLEICILKNERDGSLWVFYEGAMDKNIYKKYAHVLVNASDGMGDDWDLDSATISRYVNDNLENLTKGIGLDGFEQGADLVKIDTTLSGKLRSMYKNEKLNNILLSQT